MHPVIRIMCFLALVTTLARANFLFIFFSDLVFLAFAVISPQDIFTFSWRLMRRMRWFWLSIILLYLVMTPGGGASIAVGPLEFSLGGFWLGLERCLALLTVLLYFSLLIHTTPAAQLQGALYWLLHPLRYFGLPANRLSIRIALTLQKVQELQSRWSTSTGIKISLSSWRDIPERIAALIHEVFVQAEAKPRQSELLLQADSPSRWQWVLLILLVSLIFSVRYISTYYF